jgi:hypothetical protein
MARVDRIRKTLSGPAAGVHRLPTAKRRSPDL